MMVVVVEFAFSGSDSGYESLVIQDTTISFGVLYVFEELLNLIDQIVLFFVEGLPRQYLIPEGPAVQQHLNGRIDVAYV